MRLDIPNSPAGGSAFLGADIVAVDAVAKGAVVAIGVPGATPYGSGALLCGSAPAAIRAASQRHAPNRANYDFDLGGPLLPPEKLLLDCGDVAFDASDFAANRARIEATYAALLSRGAAPLLLGGDDSVQIPALAAFAAHTDITIVQIDAHIDWRDEVQGERWGLSSTMRRASELKGVKAMVQIGARGMGSARPSDVAEARAAGSEILDMRVLRAKGLAYASSCVPEGRPVVICLDVDGLDPSVVPGVTGFSPGGLSYTDIVELLNGIAARAPIIGFNLVEFVPENDIGALGVRTVCRLAMLGAGLLARSAES
jgi:agmatinase